MQANRELSSCHKFRILHSLSTPGAHGMHSDIKTEFLAVYDYGMGGIWFAFLARKHQEIETKYPFLVAFEKRPDFISAADYARIKTKHFHNIDEPATGLLAEIFDSFKDGKDMY
jgi:hypothetical protein